LALINFTPNFTPKKLDKLCTSILSYILTPLSKGEHMTARPKLDKETRAIGIRIPVEWHDYLAKIAEEEERSLNSLFRVAIKQYIQRRRGKK